MREAPAEGGRAVPRSTRDRLLILQQEPRNDWSVLPPALASLDSRARPLHSPHCARTPGVLSAGTEQGLGL